MKMHSQAMDAARRQAKTIQVQVLLFSSLREAVGRAEVKVELEAPATGADLVERLAAEHEAIASQRPVIRLAVDEAYASEDVLLEDGSEVALITPVSGG